MGSRHSHTPSRSTLQTKTVASPSLKQLPELADADALEVFKTILRFLRLLLCLRNLPCCSRCFLRCFRLKDDTVFDILKKGSLLLVVSVFVPIMGYLCGGLSLYAGYGIDPYLFFGCCTGMMICTPIYLISGSFSAFLVAFGVSTAVGTGVMLGIQHVPNAQIMMLPVAFLPFFFNERIGVKVLGLVSCLVYFALDLLLLGYFAYIGHGVYGSAFSQAKTKVQRILDSVIRWNFLFTASACVLLGMILLSYIDNLQQNYVLKVSEAIVSLDLDCDIVKQLQCLPDAALTSIMKNLKRTVRNVTLYRKFLPRHLLQNTKEVSHWTSSTSLSRSASVSTKSTSSNQLGSQEQARPKSRKTEDMSVLDLMNQGLRNVRGSILLLRLQGWDRFVQSNLLSADCTSTLLNGVLDAVEKQVHHYAGSFDKISGVTFQFSFGLTSRCVQHSAAACRAAEGISRIDLSRIFQSLSLAFDPSGISFSQAIVTGSFFCGNVTTGSSVKWFCRSPLFNAATTMVRLNEKLGTRILVCEDTMRINKYHFVIRRVGSTKVSDVDDPLPTHALLSQKKIAEGKEWNYQIGDTLGRDDANSLLNHAWKSCDGGNFSEAEKFFKELDLKMIDIETDVGAKALKLAIETKKVPTFRLEVLG